MKKQKLKILFFTILLLICTNTVYASDTQAFTQSEIRYIEQHKEIYVAGKSDLEPVESYNGEEYEGILPDAFKKISEVSGIKFTYINGNENWEDYAKNNQVEIVSGIENREQIEEYNLRNPIDLLEYPVDEEKMISIAFTEIADDELIEIITKSLKQIDEFQKQEVLITNITKSQRDMTLIYIWSAINTVLAIGCIILYTLYRKYKRETVEAKYVDNITHMGNYQLMEKNFNNMITDNNRSSYCIINMGIDVNHIEEIYGYSEVEQILKDISSVLDKYVEENELFARIYKDSFVIMADFISEKNIIDRVTFIINEIKDYEIEKNKTYGLDVHAGIYFFRQTDSLLKEAVHNAMLARQEAKAQGILVKICTETLIMKTKKENKLEKEMITALENKEFSTYVQPLIDLKTGNAFCLEMLARWESSKVGLVKPSTFLPILENNNLIDKLDFQMYENTCKMLAQMVQENKEPFTVFCNFSKKTIENKSFFDNLKEIAQKYGIQEKYIGIIIQEKTMSNNTATLKIMLDKLRNSGFTIMLDDFDSSTYSFKDISQFHVDYIKISARLTDSLNDIRTVEIIRGIIETFHKLNIKVICEDFKSRDNEMILKSIGCDIVQGNSYYPPIPIEEL